MRAHRAKRFEALGSSVTALIRRHEAESNSEAPSAPAPKKPAAKAGGSK